MQVQLTIIGCRPPVTVNDKNIVVIPFINKNIREEADRLYKILHQTDFLLLPTRAECAGVVFCEASAFGIPSITTDTGGVSTYVENGINGFVLPISAGAGAYTDKILDLYNNDDTYRQLCISSRNKFETALNWDAWGKSFESVVAKLLSD
jgi:glycosyltransferase involved in cell wall biosynthesis